MDDRTKAKLRGPVRTVKIEHVYRGNPIERSETYLLDGRLAEQIFHNADGTESLTINRYRPDGQLHQQEYWHEGVLNGTRRYRYDQHARLIETSGLLPNGTETLVETLSYDAQGRKTQISYIPDMSFTTDDGTTIGVDLGDGGAIFMAADPATITTPHDERDLAQQSVAHNREHQLVATLDRRYDEHSRLIEISTTIIKRGNKRMDAFLARASGEERLALERSLDELFSKDTPMNRIAHQYDDQGRVTQVSVWMHEILNHRTVTVYNDYGDELTVSEANSDRPSQPIDPSAPQTKNRFRYVYDTRGNFTQKQLSSAGQIQFTENRELTYW